MESIFDHNPTDAELDALFGSKPADDPEFHSWIKEESQKDGSDPSTLVRLFSMRGDKAEVERCLGMIKDPKKRFETEYLLLETA
jgi:hypothetical protein